MNYIIGDKVQIKTWKEMEKEFGLGMGGSINCCAKFTSEMEKTLESLNSNRIVTIMKIISHSGLYRVEGIKDLWWEWSNDMIKCKEYMINDSKDIIENRFEILDL